MKEVEEKVEEIKDDEGNIKEIQCTPVMVYKGGCNHYFEFANTEKSGADAYSCKHCPNGILVDPKTHKVVKGKLERK